MITVTGGNSEKKSKKMVLDWEDKEIRFDIPYSWVDYILILNTTLSENSKYQTNWNY